MHLLFFGNTGRAGGVCRRDGNVGGGRTQVAAGRSAAGSSKGMKAVLQRVNRASVRVDGHEGGGIDGGFVVLLGIGQDDSDADVDWMIDRIFKLRVFADDEGKMNRPIVETGGSLLVVSQFTLFADTSKSRRPEFFHAAGPVHAKKLYEAFLGAAKAHIQRVVSGTFGAQMEVALVNDGPATFILDSRAHES